MKKLNMGDICAIPIDANNYGLGQIARSVGGKLHLVLVFDICLKLEELITFDPIKLYKTPILAIVPTLISDTKKSPLYWKTLINMPLVECDLPMFVMPGDSNVNSKFSVITNFSFTHYRYIPNKSIGEMKSFFNYQSKSIETLLYNHFIDSNVGGYSRDLTFWPKGTIFESDMYKNIDEYVKWEGFLNDWDLYYNSILELKMLNEKRESDIDYQDFKRSLNESQ